MGKSEQKQIAERNKQIEGLKTQLENQGKVIEEYKQKYAGIDDVEAEIQARNELLDELKNEMGDYEAAKSIIAERDKILAEAAAQADKIKSDLADSEQALAQYRQLIGTYETADAMLSDAQKKAEEIKKQAAEEAEVNRQTILSAANTKAGEILDAAKKTEARVAQELKDARQSAGAIIKEAEDAKNSFFEKKDQEGESRKEAIIMQANGERDRIISTAKTDADTIAAGIRSSADAYASAKRAEADAYWENVNKKCEERLNAVSEQSEKILSDAHSQAKDVIREGREKRAAENEELQNEKKRLDDTQIDIGVQQAALARRENVLNEREKQLKDEVDERVSVQYGQIEAQKESYKSAFQDLKREYSVLSEKYFNMLNAKNIGKDFAEQFNRFLALARERGAVVNDDYLNRMLDAENHLSELEKERDKISMENARLRDLNAKYKGATQDAVNTEEMLRKEKEMSLFYEQKISGLIEELSKTNTTTREQMLGPVSQAPSFFVTGKQYMDDKYDGMSEKQWLDHILDKSKESGLYFTRRQLYAFHTAQKIHGMSPLVVLAGISGTGKSELPKNYAIHGGMQFLSIPVKPDWDSPASLFGYYNSIEKRFEASDLLRAIWQMRAKDGDFCEQMLMVLLDEMNLAHPEQYFADMLSKLETSRGFADAEYDILLGSGEPPERVKIGGNILWTGTMNEDETTKGLSDKVIDRSTLITFPRPKELRSRREDAAIQQQEFILKKETWDSWYKPRYADQDDRMEKMIVKFRDSVQRMNEDMSRMGRNLGHRVWQGIEAYIRNYPDVVAARSEDDLVRALNVAFNDAVAFKVMPKLRGVETKGPNEEELDKIDKELADGASELRGDFARARQMTTELFQWNSAEFMNSAQEDEKNDDGKK